MHDLEAFGSSNTNYYGNPLNNYFYSDGDTDSVAIGTKSTLNTLKPNAPVMSPYQQYIAMSRYARYLPDEQRRETWVETVTRYTEYFYKRNQLFPKQKIQQAIENLEVMPSMRALMTAGPALDKDAVAGYNCAYLPVDNQRAFDEAMYVSMCGVGIGFSVERQFTNKLPEIAETLYPSDIVLKVKDSKIGWASSFRELISLLYNGSIPTWDLSALRKEGAPLKTFGGRSSGPKPLDDLFHFMVKMFKEAAGRRLNSLECHDIMTKVGDIVVSGGVRRSALISLSNLSDDRLRTAKSGQWWVETPHRALSNNSVAYTEKPDTLRFMQEWTSLYESKSGERGIFNRVASHVKVKNNPRRKLEDDNGNKYAYGTNPCAEISLRPNEFCNLSEVVIRSTDTLETLLNKVEIAAIIGTFQSTVTNFRYIRNIWKKNCEDERLLGVSLTGIMDHPVLSQVSEEAKEWLQAMRQHAIDTNKYWAEKLGINVSAAITTVKPSGTVSQLVVSSSGIHPALSKYYIRTVRNDKKDPISDYLINCGVPHEEDAMKSTNWVFSFPMKSAITARLATDMTAIDQLEHYLQFYENWTEHNVSITVYVREHEWLEVGAWVYKHFDRINGISFLPYSDHIYKQAPYQPITEEEYTKLLAEFPKVDMTNYQQDEHEDFGTSAKMLACVSGFCEI